MRSVEEGVDGRLQRVCSETNDNAGAEGHVGVYESQMSARTVITCYYVECAIASVDLAHNRIAKRIHTRHKRWKNLVTKMPSEGHGRLGQSEATQQGSCDARHAYR